MTLQQSDKQQYSTRAKRTIYNQSPAIDFNCINCSLKYFIHIYHTNSMQ